MIFAHFWVWKQQAYLVLRPSLHPILLYPKLHKVTQGFPRLQKDLITKEEAKVIDLILCWFRDVMSCDETVCQVITYVGLELIPQCCSIGGSTEEEDGHKEVAKLTASFHCSCFLEALSPFCIIFQKATCKASSFESGIPDTLEAPEFSKWFGTFDYHEQKANIEALACIGRHKVKSANGSTSLTPVPFLCGLDPGEIFGKINIEVFMCQMMPGPRVWVGITHHNSKHSTFQRAHNLLP